MTWERVRSDVWRHAHGHLIGMGGISRCLVRANHYRMIWEMIALFYGFFEGGGMHGRVMVAVLVFNLLLFRRSWHAPDCGNLWQQPFQFTASSQKLTLDCRSRRTDSYISIHSFFAEADNPGRQRGLVLVYFNPQLLRRSWLPAGPCYPKALLFQSTASSQKLTYRLYFLRCPPGISIHSFFAEADVCGDLFSVMDPIISIHSFFAEADSKHIQSFHFTSVTLYTYCTILSHNSTFACISFDFFYSKSLKRGTNPPKFSCSLGIRTYMMKDNS